MKNLIFPVLDQWKHLETDERTMLDSIINDRLHEADALRYIIRLIIRCADLRRRLAEGDRR